MFVLLYADDTIILADSANDLQNCLTVFEEYCKRWKLFVNVEKTKIMIFSKRKITPDRIFFCLNQKLK